MKEISAKKLSFEKRKNIVIDEVFGVFKHAPLDAKAHREILSEKML